MDLNEITTDPTRIQELPTEEIPAAIAQLELEIAPKVALRAQLWAELTSRAQLERRDDQRELVLLDAEKAAELLDVTEEFLRRLMKDGEIPFVTVGRKYKKVRLVDLEKFVQRNRENAVEFDLYDRYTKRNGRKRTSSSSKKTRADTGPTGRGNRRPGKHDRSLRERRVVDFGAGRETDPSPGED